MAPSASGRSPVAVLQDNRLDAAVIDDGFDLVDRTLIININGNASGALYAEVGCDIFRRIPADDGDPVAFLHPQEKQERG
jgi:hypothetical protein